MNTIITANLGSYRNGEFLQFMKNVIAIYNKYDTNALLLNTRLQALSASTDALDEVFMSATAHELTPELQILDQRRDKALMGIKLHLESLTYREEEALVKAAQLLLTNYLSHGGRIDKLSYQQETAVVDALLHDWNTSANLTTAITATGIASWVALLNEVNTTFNTRYIDRAQTSVQPSQIEEKRTVMRNAYNELILDTVSFSRVAADKSPYLTIIDGLNGLITDYNQAVALRLAGKGSDTEGSDVPPVIENQDI